jgi:hypothetical protein
VLFPIAFGPGRAQNKLTSLFYRVNIKMISALRHGATSGKGGTT